MFHVKHHVFTYALFHVKHSIKEVPYGQNYCSR